MRTRRKSITVATAAHTALIFEVGFFEVTLPCHGNFLFLDLFFTSCMFLVPLWQGWVEKRMFDHFVQLRESLG